MDVWGFMTWCICMMCLSVLIEEAIAEQRSISSTFLPPHKPEGLIWLPKTPLLIMPHSDLQKYNILVLLWQFPFKDPKCRNESICNCYPPSYSRDLSVDSTSNGYYKQVNFSEACAPSLNIQSLYYVTWPCLFKYKNHDFYHRSLSIINTQKGTPYIICACRDLPGHTLPWPPPDL